MEARKRRKRKAEKRKRVGFPRQMGKNKRLEKAVRRRGEKTT